MQSNRSWFAPTRRKLLALAATISLSGFLPSPALADAAKPEGKKVKVLYLTQSMGFRHAPVTRKDDQLASSEVAMIAYGKESGLFDVEATQDARIITPDKLKEIDVLAFYTTGALPISPENWKAVQDWIASGKGGFIGIHSATDTGWKYEGAGMDYTTFINGKFAGHPWNQGTPIKVATWEVDHPTVKMWGASADHKDEIYQYAAYDPKAVRVLQALDFEGTPLRKPYFVPITWVRQLGKGRLFYTNFGHTPATWEDARFKQQIIEAVKFVTHQTEGATEPNPDVQALWTIHSFIAYGPDGKGQPTSGPTASAIVARLKGAEKDWLVSAAEKVTALRGAAPPDLREPRKPNPADEKKDSAKYAADLARYEADKAKYDADKPKNDEARARFEQSRKALLEEFVKKAGIGGSAAAN